VSEEVEPEAITVAGKLFARRADADGSSTPGGSAGVPTATAAGKVGLRGRRALHADEVARARGMAALLGVTAGVAAAWFPLLGGVRELQIASIVGAAYLAVVCLVFWLRARPDTTYRFLFRWFGASAVVVSVPVELYIGLFSPAPIVVTLGVSFFGGADDRRWGVGCSLAATFAYAMLALMVLVGAMPDLGLIRGLSHPTGRLFGVVMVPFILVGATWLAYSARRIAERAIAQVEDAARVVEQREAQLAEANQDLEHALEAGAGRGGRHTGRRAGDWTLGAVIGRGAMGEVYAATHATTGAVAAVKILVGNPAPEHLERFRREAEIASRLTAPSVVAVHDAGTLDGEVPYLAMELLTGHDLAWHLRKTGHMDLATAVELCRAVAAGLGAAHEVGIVHRDIKPQNLFRHEPEGVPPQWKILDFGVSKLRGSQGTLTQNRVVGTPGYMSPEQARGKEADERSDVFSLGAVMYRALTGQPPFLGADTPQILFDVVYRMPRRPGLLSPWLPADADRVLAIAIAKTPADRFASPEAFATALAAAAAGTLDAATRERGLALIAAAPWGSRIGE
jgi:serine/threonine-protein kinase